MTGCCEESHGTNRTHTCGQSFQIHDAQAELRLGVFLSCCLDTSLFFWSVFAMRHHLVKMVEGQLDILLDTVSSQIHVSQAIMAVVIVQIGRSTKPLNGCLMVSFHAQAVGIHMAEMTHGTCIAFVGCEVEVVEGLLVIAFDPMGSEVEELGDCRLGIDVTQIGRVLIVLEPLFHLGTSQSMMRPEIQSRLIDDGQCSRKARYIDDLLSYGVIVGHRSGTVAWDAVADHMTIAQSHLTRTVVSKCPKGQMQQRSRRVALPKDLVQMKKKRSQGSYLCETGEL